MLQRSRSALPAAALSFREHNCRETVRLPYVSPQAPTQMLHPSQQPTSWPRMVSQRYRYWSKRHPYLRVLLPLSVLAFFLSLTRYSAHKPLTNHLRRSRISFVRPPQQFKHFLSACVIARESSDLLPEFLVRNYMAGVDHFFIYGDDDDPVEISRLQQIFAKLDGLVTYIPHGRTAPEDEEDPDVYVQMRIYRHCLRTFGQTSNWVALIDTDEFFETSSLPFTVKDKAAMSRRAFLHDVLAAHQMFPILCVRWKTALTNGRLLPQRRRETLDDMFPRTCRVQVNNKDKLALRKTLLQPRYLDFEHSPKLDVAIHKGFKFVGDKKRLHCVWGLTHDLEPPIHLIHYWSRDLYSYLRKIRRGRPRKGVPPRTLTDLFLRESLCELEGSSGSSEIRRELIRDILDKLPFHDTLSAPFATVEQATGPEFDSLTANTTSFTYCIRKVTKFLEKLALGKDFSDITYCKGRNSASCALLFNGSASAWPFPWSEYLMNCEEDPNEDAYFT